VPVTWNPADKSGLITLSNGDLTATHDATATVGLVRATLAVPSGGKVYLEWSSTTTNGGIGIANASQSLSAYLGSSLNGVGYFSTGDVYINGVAVSTIATWAAGNIIRVAVDVLNSRIWFAVGAGNWNNSGAADPATNTGGISISGLAAGPYLPCYSGPPSASASTVNFGATTFSHAVPSGFSTLDLIASLAATLDAVTAAAAVAGADAALDAVLNPFTLTTEGYFGDFELALAVTLDALGLSASAGGADFALDLTLGSIGTEARAGRRVAFPVRAAVTATAYPTTAP
jgi:hypothetical protein